MARCRPRFAAPPLLAGHFWRARRRARLLRRRCSCVRLRRAASSCCASRAACPPRARRPALHSSRAATPRSYSPSYTQIWCSPKRRPPIKKHSSSTRLCICIPPLSPMRSRASATDPHPNPQRRPHLYPPPHPPHLRLDPSLTPTHPPPPNRPGRGARALQKVRQRPAHRPLRRSHCRHSTATRARLRRRSVARHQRGGGHGRGRRRRARVVLVRLVFVPPRLSRRPHHAGAQRLSGGRRTARQPVLNGASLGADRASAPLALPASGP